MYSADAFDLMMGTAAQESLFRYIYQQGGPALSFWQVEPATAEDNISNFLKFRSVEAAKILQACGMVALPAGDMIRKMLERNMAFACAMARVKYYRIKEPIPSSLDGKANYWKQHYNTAGGAGSVEEFKNNYLLYGPSWKPLCDVD